MAILWLMKDSKPVLVSTHVGEQFSFSLIIPVLGFKFDSNLRSFLAFWGPDGLFFWLSYGLKTVFGCYSCSLTTFILYDSFNSDFCV